MVTHDPQLAARAQRNVHVIDGHVVDTSDEVRLAGRRGTQVEAAVHA